MPPYRPPEDRFWAFVIKTEGCWEWTGHKRAGYGRFWVGSPRRGMQAHRWAYEQLVGPIPEGLELDHLCRNPPCVRPDHLEPVTRLEHRHRRPPATRCKNGHPFGDDRDHRGNRFCRICRNAAERARYRADPAKAYAELVAYRARKKAA